MSVFGPESKEVFSYFEAISGIPRGSGNEKAISDYLVDFAISQKLEYSQDHALNVIIKKPATKGYEKSSPVLLQGHIDMVCEKNVDTVHDFLKDPIKLKIEGDNLKAEGTTLGADNGIAIAYILALLSSKDIMHPPIEALMTTNEETGMDGARAVDVKQLSARRVINIDSEEEGELLVSCAGGVRLNLHLPIRHETPNTEYHAFSVKIRKLKGGHSGMEIDKQRANANKLMGRVLSELCKLDVMQISHLGGGLKENAIPRESDALIVTRLSLEMLKEQLNCLEKELQNEYKTADADIAILVEAVSMPKTCLTVEATKKIIDVLVLMPNGVQSMSLSIKGLVESSLNLGIVNQKADEVVFSSSIRSCVKSRKLDIANKIRHLAELVNATVHLHGDYPAWEYQEHSKLRETFLAVYQTMYGVGAKISAIHAGLECGLLSEKMPEADMISIGPNMYDVHTPDEKVSISSVNRTWEYLKAVLKGLK